MNEEQLEQKAIEQVEVAPKTLSNPMSKTNPLEVQAQFFSSYFPRLQALVRKLSNKQLRRVLLAGAEHPLNEKPFHFTTQDEKDAFAIFLNLCQSNAMMQLAVIAGSNEFNLSEETNQEGVNQNGNQEENQA